MRWASAGTVPITLAVLRTAPEYVPALAADVGAFVLAARRVDGVQPMAAQRRQAGAGALRPGGDFPLHRRDLHALPRGSWWSTPKGIGLTVFVWSASLIGVTLKLVLPQRFVRLAILLYLAIGWSGILVFQDLAHTLPPPALVLLLAGGLGVFVRHHLPPVGKAQIRYGALAWLRRHRRDAAPVRHLRGDGFQPLVGFLPRTGTKTAG